MNWRGLVKFLRFSVKHSLRDMWRNRGRTMFALVCVATGVAAVVALRSLAFMVGDKLTTSLAELNRSDIRVYASRGVPELIELSTQRTSVFNADALAAMRVWAADEGVDLTVGRMEYFASILPIVDGEGQTAATGQVLFIEPEYYPFYDTIYLREPAELTLTEFYANANTDAAGTLDDPRPVVIANNMARESSLNLRIGDVIRIGAQDAYFEVQGIASAEAETIVSNPSAAFLGDYVYLPFDDLALVGESVLPDQVFIRVPLGHDIAAAESSLIAYLQASFDTDRDFDKELNRASVPELEEQNEETADVIDDLILTMGLSSLLIGGIGIINTMLVVVSRRTLEIAVLKTLGLKGYRVTFLFLVEALLLGVIGSLIGIAIGVILSYTIRDVGEEAFKLTLTWRLYPEAILSGLFLGVLMTGLFGFLPTLIAGQVRPAVVLRPNEAQMPAAGLLQTLLTLVIMIVILGLMVSSIVEGAIEYNPVYMIAGAGALVGLFAGVIVANTRLGQPIPKAYVFRLSRRFDRLESWLIRAAELLFGWLPSWNQTKLKRGERGRAAITAGLRGFRQLVLLYGALAIGAAVASGIMLVVSEVWLPFGLGANKPAGDIDRAISDGDLVWIAVWIAYMLGIGYLIRRYARGLVSVLALGSIGVTLGGMIGWIGGSGLEAVLGDRGIWHTLAKMSTGVVLVEGAMALMAAVYVGYWLLVWAVGKLPNGVFMVVIGVIVLSLAAGAAAGLALLGPVVLVVALVLIVGIWIVGRPHPPAPSPSSGERESGISRRGESVWLVVRSAVRGRGAAAVLASMGAMVGGFLLFAVGATWHIVAVIAGIMLIVLWWHFRRTFAIDGRLILREMGGRRSRLASTLLGLSVGIAGLSVVSLTTGAVSHLLEVQLGENAEGNLLILDPSSQYAEQVSTLLSETDGVEQFSQVTSYNGMLLTVNGEDVQTRR
ncbi:MAG: ABC transporter permease, partial [Anaerolineae bacterium]|nr:ABC transporter permease [Anaerolineae bacterium]